MLSMPVLRKGNSGAACCWTQTYGPQVFKAAGHHILVSSLFLYAVMTWSGFIEDGQGKDTVSSMRTSEPHCPQTTELLRYIACSELWSYRCRWPMGLHNGEHTWNPLLWPPVLPILVLFPSWVLRPESTHLGQGTIWGECKSPKLHTLMVWKVQCQAWGMTNVIPWTGSVPPSCYWLWLPVCALQYSLRG
jgi:hypothetical protein